MPRFGALKNLVHHWRYCSRQWMRSRCSTSQPNMKVVADGAHVGGYADTPFLTRQEQRRSMRSSILEEWKMHRSSGSNGSCEQCGSNGKSLAIMQTRRFYAYQPLLLLTVARR